MGLGLGTKALRLLITKAENLKLRKIFLRVNEKNFSAIKLYEKMNFKSRALCAKTIITMKRLSLRM